MPAIAIPDPAPDPPGGALSTRGRVMAEATPRPWEYSNRDFRGVEHPHNVYVTGNRHESEDDNDNGECCTSIATVHGNATSGSIPDANAALIVRAVNSFDALVAALEQALARILQLGGEDEVIPEWANEDGTVLPSVSEPDPTCEKIRAALAAAKKGGE